MPRPRSTWATASGTRADSVEAIAAYRRAIALRPDYAEAHNNLGNVFREQGRLDEARRRLPAGDRAEARHAAAHNNLGNVFTGAGAPRRGAGLLPHAIELKPDSPTAASNLLFALHYPSGLTMPRRSWRSIAAGPGVTPSPWPRRFGPHANDRSPDRRLRVGFVSPDFRDHPVGRLLLPLFSHHDRRQAEFVGYSDVRVADGVTRSSRRGPTAGTRSSA